MSAKLKNIPLVSHNMPTMFETCQLELPMLLGNTSANGSSLQISVPTGLKNPEIMKIEDFGFSHIQIENHKFKLKQNNSTEFSG